MARKKCYFCEERFDEAYTTRTRAKTGGSYNRASGFRPVRACYRCIARQEYRRAYQNATGDTRVSMLARGWVLPEDYYDHQHGWAAFDLLWPEGQWGPTDPTTIPERLLPPAQEA